MGATSLFPLSLFISSDLSWGPVVPNGRRTQCSRRSRGMMRGQRSPSVPREEWGAPRQQSTKRRGPCGPRVGPSAAPRPPGRPVWPGDIHPYLLRGCPDTAAPANALSAVRAACLKRQITAAGAPRVVLTSQTLRCFHGSRGLGGGGGSTEAVFGRGQGWSRRAGRGWRRGGAAAAATAVPP